MLSHASGSPACARSHFPRCGNVQRVSWWFGSNADCASVAGELDFFPCEVNKFFADTGEAMNEVPLAQGVGCYVKEPRKFLPQCTGLATTCNAGWQCVSNQAPPTVRKIARLLASSEPLPP